VPAAEAAFAIIAAACAFGCYRAGAFFGWRWRWVTREEEPRQFWSVIVLYSGIALIFAGFALRDVLAA